MSLRTRLTALAQAIGLDIKNLQTQIDTLEGSGNPTVTYNPWQRFDITVNTTSLPVTYTPGMINVYMNGRLLRPNGDDYNATNGTSVDFTFTLTPGIEIDVESVTITEDPVNQAVTVDRRTYTNDLVGEDTFAVNYSSSYVKVFVNGFLIPPTDYVYTSGTQVVLNSVLTDEVVSVDVIGYVAFAVADTYSTATADSKFIPQNPVTTAAKTILDGTETLQGESSGLKKFTVQAIIDYLLARASSWTGINTFKVILTPQEYNAGNSGTAATVNFANGQKQKLSLTGNATVTIQCPGVSNYQLRLIQDATGNRTVTWAGYATVKYVGSATAPAINLSANSETIVNIFHDGATTIWVAASKVNA